MQHVMIVSSFDHVVIVSLWRWCGDHHLHVVACGDHHLPVVIIISCGDHHLHVMIVSLGDRLPEGITSLW
jgi:hypothetical protein